MSGTRAAKCECQYRPVYEVCVVAKTVEREVWDRGKCEPVISTVLDSKCLNLDDSFPNGYQDASDVPECVECMRWVFVGRE